MKLFDYFIITIAISFMIFLGYSILEKKNNPVFEYNFIPRTFQEETENPVALNYYFEDLFSRF